MKYIITLIFILYGLIVFGQSTTPIDTARKYDQIWQATAKHHSKSVIENSIDGNKMYRLVISGKDLKELIELWRGANDVHPYGYSKIEYEAYVTRWLKSIHPYIPYSALKKKSTK